jgi:hypothetical protein
MATLPNGKKPVCWGRGREGKEGSEAPSFFGKKKQKNFVRWGRALPAKSDLRRVASGG